MRSPLAALAKFVRFRLGIPFVRRADRFRDRAEWIEAVIAYRRGLDWMPWREDLLVQIGNCLKEFGDYPGAVRAYASVVGPSQPEAVKQLADARVRAGADLLPYATAERPPTGVPPPDVTLPPVTARLLPNRVLLDRLDPRRALGALGRGGVAVRWRGDNFPGITLVQVGAMSATRDGVAEPLLAGVVAVRARLVAPVPLGEAEIWLGEGADARRIAVAPLRAVERGPVPVRLHVLNAWIDAATLPEGRHWLSVRAGGGLAPRGLHVSVARADALGPELLSSNAFVPSPGPGGGDPAAAVAAAPAVVRPAGRTLFGGPVRSVLAVRADQLGDVSASLAALARLRALFPDARLTVLAQSFVRAVIEASGLADEMMEVTLRYDVATERRHLSSDEEERLRAACAARRFDLAVDLCPGDETRPLLLLTGATWLVGFNADRFTYLDFGIGLRSRDKVNGLECLSHAAAVMSLVEALGVAAAPALPRVPRLAPSGAVLARHGLEAGRYVVLHTGARHALNRWPVERFLELAGRIADRGDHRVVLFCEPGERPASASRGVLFLHMVEPDAFDAVVANARALVGNDSGPKHLAAARGVPTVSVHVDRLNWNEWGQNGVGAIVSKRVPCTGCGLNDLDLCGLDAVCVRSIGVDEVWAALRPLL